MAKGTGKPKMAGNFKNALPKGFAPKGKPAGKAPKGKKGK